MTINSSARSKYKTKANSKPTTNGYWQNFKSSADQHFSRHAASAQALVTQSHGKNTDISNVYCAQNNINLMPKNDTIPETWRNNWSSWQNMFLMS